MSNLDKSSVSQEQRNEQRSSKNPRSLENLKPFETGKSGNPGGRPKGKGLTKAIRDVFDEPTVERIAENLKRICLWPPSEVVKTKTKAGLYQWAINIVLDRMDGKVSQPIGVDRESTVRFVIDPGKSLASNDDGA